MVLVEMARPAVQRPGVKLLSTGVTGYIAGDAVHAIHEEHPDFQYAFLVRTEEKATIVKNKYPKARIVLGGLDDASLLEEEAAKADVVLHAADASDHERAARAIAAGLVKGHSKRNPGYWLHTGGTGILTYKDSENDFKTLGCWTDKEYNDLAGVEELTTLPDEAFHRNVDKIVLETGAQHGDSVKTVIVCPPTIYGTGRGPVSGRGRQVYELAKLVLQKQYIPVIGEGKARWNNVHVADLADVFRLLVNKAADQDTNNELWGSKGYLLVENGEHLWTDLAKLVGKEAAQQGFIKSPSEDSLSKDDAIDQAGFEAVSWGLNSRGRAERARKYLGWAPSRRSIEEEIPTIVKEEHSRLSKA
ncbi:NAD(P)-binding protein [Myriangium duriaei CBS 260.36]|uniref:NAD(P)-binding protein n=1 Tax=Myriangium duriaei CBS 260.36 TaxID=1168546 RepID=A0A9P4J053_9PEZI|nr:NAD(P)-binding protein [Myriangium duriaei CBS 260.36]